MVEPKKILLPQNEFPQTWVNIVPHMMKASKGSVEPKDPESGPSRLKQMQDYFSPSLLAQERSKEEEILIPDEVKELLLRVGRPTPLQRADRLENLLKTPAKIYYKREDISYSTTDKTNTSIPQAYYIAKDGFEKIISGGGAQWGSAISIGAAYQQLTCEFFLPKSYLELKEPHRILMETNKVSITGSPSNQTQSGIKAEKERLEEPGNISIAMSEVIEKSTAKELAFAWGCFYNVVMLHQSISGTETKKQLKLIGRNPDVIVGSLDSFGGFASPFIIDKLRGDVSPRFVIAQSSYVPVIGEGKLDFDFADYAELTPLYRFHSLGHKFNPPMIHAGEFRYHGVSPIISHLIEARIVESTAYGQTEAFEAGITFAKCQGIVPSCETQYAIKAVIEEALKAKEEGKEKVIVFNMGGHTMLEHSGYLEYLADKKLKLP